MILMVLRAFVLCRGVVFSSTDAKSGHAKILRRALEQPSERAQKPYNQRVTEAPSNLPKSHSQNQHSSNHEHSLEGKNRSPFSGDNDFCKAFDLTFLVLIFEKLLKPVLHPTATVEHVNTGVF